MAEKPSESFNAICAGSINAWVVYASSQYGLGAGHSGRVHSNPPWFWLWRTKGPFLGSLTLEGDFLPVLGPCKAGWELVFDVEQSSLCMRSAVPQEGSASRAGAGWRAPAGAGSLKHSLLWPGERMSHKNSEWGAFEESYHTWRLKELCTKFALGLMKASSLFWLREMESSRSGMDHQALPDSSLLSCPPTAFFGPWFVRLETFLGGEVWQIVWGNRGQFFIETSDSVVSPLWLSYLLLSMFSWDFRKAEVIHFKWTLWFLSGKNTVAPSPLSTSWKACCPLVSLRKRLFLAESIGYIGAGEVVVPLCTDSSGLMGLSVPLRSLHWLQMMSYSQSQPQLTSWVCPHTAMLDSHQLDSEWKFKYWPEWLTSSLSSRHKAMRDETKPRQGQDVCACSLWEQELDQSKSPVSASWQLTWLLRCDGECCGDPDLAQIQLSSQEALLWLRPTSSTRCRLEDEPSDL